MLGSSESALPGGGVSQDQINTPAIGIASFLAEMTITVDGATAAFATTTLVASTSIEEAIRSITTAIDIAQAADSVIIHCLRRLLLPLCLAI